MPKYTHADLQKAFEVWSKANPNNRQQEWFLYLDIRENVPLGTHEGKHLSMWKTNDREYKPNKRDLQRFQ